MTGMDRGVIEIEGIVDRLWVMFRRGARGFLF